MLENFVFDCRRINKIIDLPFEKGTIAYWMSRDQRVNDNWALLFSINIALKTSSKLIVIFCLLDDYLNAHPRNFHFMLNGLLELNKKLEQCNIPFYLIEGDPKLIIQENIKKHNITGLITDFDPLKIKKNWKLQISKRISIPFYEIDTHNIVPCWIASKKQEWGAYTLRPKINKLLTEFLTEIPEPTYFNLNSNSFVIQNNLDTEQILIKRIKNINHYLDWIKAGEISAKKHLQDFINNKLRSYHINKNKPSIDGLSNLSPFLHFGMISSQRIALEVLKSDFSDMAKQSYLEELIVRKELADNYCYYNQNYDNFEGFPEWAKNSLNLHRNDRRERIYTLQELEDAKTYDELWNFAEFQMITTGKMHGYLRMYWAKKILEWTKSPEEAQEFAIYLNDKYSIDGRDPNGYTGIAWCLGGLHDRPWKERKIFGKIRYMSHKSQIKKIRLNL